MSPQFPQLPETRVTRQIECVSCRHHFTVSEDIPKHKNGRSFKWRRTPDHDPYINPRHRPNIFQQRANPGSNGQLHEKGDLNPYQGGRLHDIVCPRCGTDNRNWVHLTIPPLSWRQRIMKAPIIILSPVIAATLFILFLLRMGNSGNNLSRRDTVIFLIAIFILGWLLPLIVSGQWKKLRDHKYETSIGLNRSFWSRLSPPARIAWTIFFSLWIILPFFIFIMLPWGKFQVQSRISPVNAPTLPQRINTIFDRLPSAIEDQNPGDLKGVENSIVQLSLLVNEVEQSCDTSSLPKMIGNLESMGTPNPLSPRTVKIDDAIYQLSYLQSQYNNSACQKELLTRAIFSLNTLRQHEDAVCEADAASASCGYRDVIDTMIADLDRLQIYATNQEPFGPAVSANEWATVLQRLQPIANSVPNNAIQLRIENHLSVLEAFAGINITQTWLTTSFAFLEAWVLYIGFAGTISIISSISAIYTIMSWADRQLPRPIYTNVSRLTRVVIWEARRALEINENIMFENIQWMSVNRNSLGGVDLIGLFRDPPEIMADGIISHRVSAQQYMFHSDRWGRIEEALIVDRQAPLPAGYQIQAIGGQDRLNLPATRQSLPPGSPNSGPNGRSRRSSTKTYIRMN